MRYHIFACDYDGTLARNGHVDEPTVSGLRRLLGTGRQLVLVTGRQLAEVLALFPEFRMFARIVAENGALIYDPAKHEEKALAKAPPAEFLCVLHERGVAPLSNGRVVVATWRPHETTVLQTIVDLGLELQVIFNKDAVMVLPSGTNKATGLAAALSDLGFSPHEAVGIGDAENDHAFLGLCECGVAVNNSVSSLKRAADLVTRNDQGAGVTELVGHVIENDLADVSPRLTRHRLFLGSSDGEKIWLDPYGYNLLIAGPSSDARTKAVMRFLHLLTERRYQWCVLDAHETHGEYEGAMVLTESGQDRLMDEALQLLQTPGQNAVVDLSSLPQASRSPVFRELSIKIQALRVSSGRPHWLVINEADEFLSACAETLSETVMVTANPAKIAATALVQVEWLAAAGESAKQSIDSFCAALAEPAPHLAVVSPVGQDVYLWSRSRKIGYGVRFPE